MQSTLIRYTNHEYVDSILKGELYLSSLSTFWDFMKGKITSEDIATGKVTKEDIQRAEAYDKLNQQDFSEGIANQVPKNILDELIDTPFSQYACHDVRFRIEAYGYCNLLCFFRVDADEVRSNNIPLDVDNIALLAEEKKIRGIHSYQDVQRLSIHRKIQLLKSVSEPNPLLNPNKNYIVRLPPKIMDGFGDCVIVIKDEELFIQRILKAVKEQGGECVVGDVRYHKIQNNPITEHHITLLSDNPSHSFQIRDFNKKMPGILHYGSLDKYDRYANQREWRVCWLPEEHNHNPKILHVGDISDIVEVKDSTEIRRYLLKQYSGCFPGIIWEERKSTAGTISYGKFKEIVEGIDGKCRLLFDIG